MGTESNFTVYIRGTLLKKEKEKKRVKSNTYK